VQLRVDAGLAGRRAPQDATHGAGQAMNRPDPQPSRRALSRSAAVLWLLAASAGGCGVLGAPGGPPATTLLCSEDPRTVAWALASLCRDAHPSTDERGGGPVPLVRDPGGAFRIAIGRGGPDDPYRCETNGRLPAPHPFLAPDRSFTWLPQDFVAGGEHTVAPGRADRLEILVRATGDGATAVRIDSSGEAARPALRRRLAAAVEVLSTTRESAILLRSGASRGVAIGLERSLARLEVEQVTGLGVLLAPVHAHLAAARLADGDLPAARLALSAAIGAAPRIAAFGAELATLDTRLARIGDAIGDLEDLADRPLGGAMARIAAGRAEATRALGRSTTTAIGAHRTARRLLADGDLDAATAWSRRAHGLARDGTASLELELARARGEHRLAFVLGIERMQRFGFEPGLALAMAEDADRYGDPAAGLRLLARHWRALAEAGPGALEALAARLADRAGPDLTTRVALAERAEPLAARALRPLRTAEERPGLPAARLASLRALAQRAPPERNRPLDGFELAPGVAPAR
jgi:hypothetical protein